MSENNGFQPPGRLIGRRFSAPPRAIFATNPEESRGRYWPEEESPTRSCYQRDRDRLIHSTAFRRLKHKTQVFVQHEGDYYRTRLTHSLEVAQIARSIARVLGLDEDLAEALALAHDFGHPPFGHAGEAALNACMTGFGGFDHNAQALALVTRLEHRYVRFDGLNLTWETLEGLVKHNGPLTDRDGRPVERYRERGLPRVIAEYCRVHDLDLWSWPSAEAQAGAISDDIAYDAHDIDDGLRAGMFELGDLAGLPLIGDILRDISREHPRLEASRHAHELVRRVITRMIEDVIAESRRRIAALGPKSATDIRNAGAPVIGFSPEFAEADKAIKAFLDPRLYRHTRIMRIMGEAEAAVRRLFDRLVETPADLPPEWLAGLDPGDAVGRALRIADYIAGMTDRYAIGEHARLFGWTPELK